MVKKEIILLSILVLVSRIPFLFYGYGVEEDSWGIAISSLNWNNTGQYEVSRLPGHPVHELFCMLLINQGAVALNFLSAIMSVAATVFFALSVKKMGVQDYFMAGLVFAFVPVLYISSTYTIDYVWGMAFLMAGLYFMLGERFVSCGIMLGLAVGCRITSAAMLVPMLILTWPLVSKGDPVKNILKLLSVFTFTSVLFYLPVYFYYGSGFFMYYDQFPYPSIAKIFYKGTFGVWGLLGIVSLILGTGYYLKNIRTTGWSGRDKRIFVACIAACILYLASYLRLPQKSAYMMPIIPFVVLLFASRLSNPQFKVISILFILSPFVMGISLTDSFRGSKPSPLSTTVVVNKQEIAMDFLQGPLFADISKRKNKNEFVDKVLEQTCRMSEKSFIISGWWFNQIIMTTIESGIKPCAGYGFYITSEEMKKQKELGNSIYFLPEQDIYNDLYSGIKETNQYATEFKIK